jgi:hypothetical protein
MASGGSNPAAADHSIVAGVVSSLWPRIILTVTEPYNGSADSSPPYLDQYVTWHHPFIFYDHIFLLTSNFSHESYMPLLFHSLELAHGKITQ